MTTTARYWHLADDGRIQCDLCPRHCRLNDGQRAFCFVRAREGDSLVLTTWGRSTGFCVDPIEKKPLNHFLPGTSVLSFGTAGCNLGCRFCQNWDISKARDVERLSDEARPEAIARAALDAGCRSVAFTYNDPVLWAEFAIDTARACHAVGLKTVAVTAGYITEQARPDFFGAMDAANIDLKAFSETFYRQLCYAELGPVLDTLRWVARETSVWLEVTTLLIPGQNDSDDEIQRLSAFCANELGPHVPLHFTGFHPDFRMRDTPRTPLETLQRARHLARAEGVQFVYTGNVHDPEGDATRCPSCDTLLIARDWHRITGWHLRDGCCPDCGARIPGVFEAQRGVHAGRRRVLVAPPKERT
ncbi:MAG: AmmeMemoRadiSam system radical SAM enzyme [Deltaproteobacteria bacterium]|nr:AmmeMemoRadiSam system radical SAM enzyme [Deltaproteobacteria bacterium]MCB9788785.1 AmmeMemoRadiSam system radical SAM enzyme [Deltaproteobacteria bacterium]